MEAPNSNHASSSSTSKPKPNPRTPKTIDQTQFIRIIVQSLYSLGYRKAAAELESESCVALDIPEHDRLLWDIMSGRFDSCIDTINSVAVFGKEFLSVAAFLVWKEHFLELLGTGNAGFAAARDVLWQRIAPLSVDRCKVHELACALVSGEKAVVAEDVVRRRMGLFLDLVEMMPPWVKVPGGRLEHLVENAVAEQVASCLYHNFPDEITLFEDHRCGEERIPSECSQVLCDHKNEVWFVRFSNNGKYLASSSSDCTAIIWTVEDDDTWTKKNCLKGHEKPVSFLAWSPDDKMLLTCGNGEAYKLWNIDTGMCSLRLNSPANRVINSCAWFPDSEKMVCASSEPDNRIFTCDLDGHELDVWEGERIPKVYDLAVTPDGRHMICICYNREIWIRELPKGKERIIREEQSITSLSLSSDGRSLIVNLNSQEIHLWKVDEYSDMPDKFEGHKQGQYVIRSCFGGSDCLFIASGSEDSQVYIWQRNCGTPIKVLYGHSMTVNCVSWNPVRSNMLASASDDCTVRIWLANKSPYLQM